MGTGTERAICCWNVSTREQAAKHSLPERFRVGRWGWTILSLAVGQSFFRGLLWRNLVRSLRVWHPVAFGDLGLHRLIPSSVADQIRVDTSAPLGSVRLGAGCEVTPNLADERPLRRRERPRASDHPIRSRRLLTRLPPSRRPRALTRCTASSSAWGGPPFGRGRLTHQRPLPSWRGRRISRNPDAARKERLPKRQPLLPAPSERSVAGRVQPPACLVTATSNRLPLGRRSKRLRRALLGDRSSPADRPSS